MIATQNDVVGLLAGINENRYDPFLRDVLADALYEGGNTEASRYQREVAKVLRMEDADEVYAADVVRIASYYLGTMAAEEADHVVLQAVLHRWWGVTLQNVYPGDDMGSWKRAAFVLAVRFDRAASGGIGIGHYPYLVHRIEEMTGVALPLSTLLPKERGGTD